ncbi:recombinase family protein [Kitasatospora cineracea]|uniref:Site-specific DNA recombinase n=1 Tax=Kitasatospora cineracea TaxID=88074 RepID=A0A8G1UJ89_9ACTN|nr:recombinase family protein [Kitasatospora cineracea]ROR42707.1 site-specific DNA recombinase [Kitasatospora cineracea]
MTDATTAAVRAMPRARRPKGVPAGTTGLRAAIYVRLSRETEETTSPERQRAACEALCQARGWTVVAVEEDIDVSGFSRGLERPGLQRVLSRLTELDVVVFFKIDRLARSTVDFAEIMRITETADVALASATEPLDLTTSMGRAMAKVIAVFAELESDTIGMRVSSAHEHLRREGRYTGGRVPYGYRVAPNPDGAGKVLEVNPEEAETVRGIVERVLAKDSLMTVAADLSKAGVPSPGHTSRQTTGKRSDSKKWYTTTLRSLLTNPQLLGQVIEDGKPILRTDGLPLVNRMPILDIDIWQALQDELERRSHPGDRRREGTSLLRGIVHCALCGFRMYTYMAGGRLRYRCIGRLKKRQGGERIDCYGVSIAGESMENHVEARFLESFGRLPVVRVVEQAGEDFRPQIRQAQEALSDLEKDRYDRGLFKGDDGADRYAAQYAKLEDRVASLKEKQRTAKPGGVVEVPTGRTFGQHWKAADTAGKRDLLLHAGAFVEVSPATKSGPAFDASRLAVRFGTDGRVKRADAEGKDVEAVIRQAEAEETAGGTGS